jgi:streptogramin lyase
MGSLWANQIRAYPSGTPPGPLKGSVDRVDPSTDEFHAVLTNASLSLRMVVAGGFVWVYDNQNRAIERVDPGTGSVSRIGSEPVSIGAGDVTDSLAYADGGLWFPACGADGCPVTGPLSVRRLDVSTGAVSTIPLSISGTIEKTASGHIERNVGLHVVAADANSVWLMVANQTSKGDRSTGYWGGRLIRTDISTRRVQAVTIGAYGLSGLIADGDLWLADSQHHSVLRVDP